MRTNFHSDLDSMEWANETWSFSTQNITGRITSFSEDPTIGWVANSKLAIILNYKDCAKLFISLLSMVDILVCLSNYCWLGFLLESVSCVVRRRLWLLFVTLAFWFLERCTVSGRRRFYSHVDFAAMGLPVNMRLKALKVIMLLESGLPFAAVLAEILRKSLQVFNREGWAF